MNFLLSLNFYLKKLLLRFNCCCGWTHEILRTIFLLHPWDLSIVVIKTASWEKKICSWNKSHPSTCHTLRVWISLHSLFSLSPALFTCAAFSISWCIISKYVVLFNSLSDTYKFALVILILLQECCIWTFCWLCSLLSQQDSSWKSLKTQWILQIP